MSKPRMTFVSVCIAVREGGVLVELVSPDSCEIDTF
jgi:hypothetical protein